VNGFDEATLAQIAAANPAASTWLTANAGSGKTKVLTDRVTRLLLEGVDPEGVLCLTYTKAAAAEMQNRLFKRLGEWTMMDDGRLLEELAKTGVSGAPDLGRARTLFARAIETPGGIKIQTIHAFCSMLLRRFPLEAGVSPGFRELDDADGELLRAEVIDALAREGAVELDAVAEYLSIDDLAELSKSVVDAAPAFPSQLDRGALAECLGISSNLTTQMLIAELLGNDRAETLSALKAALSRGSSNDLKALAKIASVDPANVTASDHVLLEAIFLTSSGANPFTAKVGRFPTKATCEAMGRAIEPLNAMMKRAEHLREKRLALAALEKADALRRFAQRFLPAYEAAKAARGVLDFADLITRANRLLSDHAVAEWVLWRIDGDIDHILVDEAQDTSPSQWDVIAKLAAEMSSGKGARENTRRTIFVVGDLKQSIYSFQGADPREMEKMRAHFSGRLRGGEGLADLQLVHSFRSAPAILSAVDATFTGPRAAGLGGHVDHTAFKDRLPGRVDLWPIEEPGDKDEEAEWFDPVDRVLESAPAARLAKRIAREVRGWVDSETIPAESGQSRSVTESDVLILVQGRNALFHQIIRACKVAGLTVAGADRMRIRSELAARDIVAVLSFLALPEDDLALAAALRSPLFGWSEQELYRLAHRRPGFLWEALRKENDRFGPTVAVLTDLRRQSDFLRPHEVIERLLTRHGGRARLLARLGAEAEEGIDALLGEAMRYEQSEPPSLTGFLSWHDSQSTEIKRQSAGAEAGIRVMTVHGAKGLESPIVILPDTLRDDRERPRHILMSENGMPLWSLPRADRPSALAAAAAARREAEEEERRRLLYVAMTRAENWLVVAGAGEAPKKGDTWYEAVADGLTAAHAAPVTLPDGSEILRLQNGAWPEMRAAVPQPSIECPDYPTWMDLADCSVPEVARPLSPSDLGGEKVLAGESVATEEEDPLAYGSALHLLLEHLPGLPGETHKARAASLLPDIGPELLGRLCADAGRLIGAPHLAHLFAPGSLAEVDFVATLDGHPLRGTIDRLLVDAERVLAVDFKSNRVVPDRPEDVPAGLLRQMGAYEAALARIYPGRRIETSILWTATGTIMALPHDIVSAALARPSTS